MLADKLHKRIEYVDILKGIGIICVLLGHNLVVQDDGQLPEIMRYIIYSFHIKDNSGTDVHIFFGNHDI